MFQPRSFRLHCPQKCGVYVPVSVMGVRAGVAGVAQQGVVQGVVIRGHAAGMLPVLQPRVLAHLVPTT